MENKNKLVNNYNVLVINKMYHIIPAGKWQVAEV